MRRLLLPLLGLALLAHTATAQTTPKKSARPATKTTRPAATARRTADPLAGTSDGSKGQAQSGYAAPGEPIQDPRYNGKNTPPYDGGTAPAKRNTTLGTPK